MAVTYNLKGTSNPYFKIGKSGSTLFQGTSDPSGSYSVENGDVWFDTSNGTLKFRSSGSWSGITTASDLNVTGNLTVSGTTTTVNSTTIDVQNSVRFEGATADEYETILTVADPTADRTITLPDASGTVAFTSDLTNYITASTTDTLTNKTITNAASISITNAQTTDSLLLTTTEASSTAGPVITLKRNSASPADSDYMGQIKFKGENDNDDEITYAKITGKILDASNGTEDGMLEYSFIKAGSQNISGRFRSDQFQLLNGTSLYVGAGGNLTFEGSTSNSHETTIAITDPTQDNTITIPDETGTIVTKSSNTGAIAMPVGTTAQRPGTPSTGMIRFNTDIDYFEGYNGATWVKLGHSTPTGDTRDYGAITDTSSVSNIDYGAVTDSDTYTKEYGSVTDDDEV